MKTLLALFLGGVLACAALFTADSAGRRTPGPTPTLGDLSITGSLNVADTIHAGNLVIAEAFVGNLEGMATSVTGPVRVPSGCSIDFTDSPVPMPHVEPGHAKLCFSSGVLYLLTANETNAIVICELR